MEKVTLGTATLYHGDCMELMQGLEDRAFELAIVDPPYGINAPNMKMGENINRVQGNERTPSTAKKLRTKGRLNAGSGKLKNRLLNQSAIGWDNERPTQAYFDDLFRVSMHQVIWGGNYFDLPGTRGFAIWDKCQPWPNFSACEFAWESSGKPSKIFSLGATGGDNKEKKIHPTQKPVALYEWLLTNYAKTGDKILDTHLGSGSSAIAANKLGFEFVGIELDKDYFDAACKRIDKALSQQDLFAPQVIRPSDQIDLYEANNG